jgi:hypothetical protein
MPIEHQLERIRRESEAGAPGWWLISPDLGRRRQTDGDGTGRPIPRGMKA